jgi:hypothetical protein
MPETELEPNVTARRKALTGLWSMLLVALAFAAIPLSYVMFTEYAAISPWGTDAFLWLGLFFIIPLLPAAAIVFLGAPIAVCFRKTRRIALISLVLAAFYVLGVVGGAIIGGEIRMWGFARLADRSETLVMAIKSYEARFGRPPDSLDSLVPEFIPAIPSTGMRAYPKYEYVAGEEAKQFDKNPWALYVFTPSGGINFDQFMYLPRQNYPKYGYGGYLQRLGDWAYVHE